MKRILTISLLTLLVLSACDREDPKTPVGPEMNDPSLAKQVLPDFAPPDECSNCIVAPQVMVRATKAPTVETVEFDATEGEEAELVVQVSNPETATVKAWLNGKTVLLPSVLPQSGSDQVRVPIILKEKNVLQLRLSGKPGNSAAFWVEGAVAPDAREPLWVDVGVVPTGSTSAPVVAADNAGLAILLLTDPESGAPEGAATALPGMEGLGLVRFDPAGIPVAGFFGGGVAYLTDWTSEGGVASVSVTIPPGGALPQTAVSVALPNAFVSVVDWFLTASPTSSPGAVFETAQLQALSGGEALAAQAAWCALEVAGTLPASADACRTTLVDGVPAFWDQWTPDIGYEPFLPTVTGSLNLAGCTGADCLAQAEVLAFATMADATPRKLTVFSGDAQTGTTGTALADAIQVLLTNEFDVPLGGFLAEFSVTSGGGILDGAGAAAAHATDAAGVAGASWTLGSQVGEQGVGATTISFLDLQAGFTATAEETAPTVVFHATTTTVGPTANMNATCVAEFGDTFGMASWADVSNAVDGGMAKGDILSAGMAMISYNGTGAFSPGFFEPTRHYMISTMDLGEQSALVIGADLFWLTSGTTDQPVLCVGPQG